MKHLTILVTLLFIATINFAQVSNEQRLEIEIKDGFSQESILPFEEDGFLLRTKKDKLENGNFLWKFQLYNTSLKSTKSKTFMVPKGFYLDESIETKKNAHSLFKNKKGEFILTTVSLPHLSVKKVDGKLPKKSRVYDMAVLGDIAYFQAYLKGSPYLFSVNWKTGKQTTIPIDLNGVSLKNIYPSHFQLLEETNEVFLFVSVKIDRKKRDQYILKFDAKGNKKAEFNLSKNTENVISYASVGLLENGKYIFTGTYNSRASAASEGIFICKATGTKVGTMHFYKFLDFKNFLSYLPKRKQEKLERKKARKEARGKELKINYRIATHDVIKMDDGFVLVGEAYYPTYRTETYTTVVNGQTVTRTRTVFDGYQYTHAFIAKFSEDGIKKWDQTFEMWPSYKPFYVKRFISITEQSTTKVKLVFASRSSIFSKAFDSRGRIVSDDKTSTIQTSFEGDKTKYSFSNMDYWYDNYFFAYGYQKIKNKTGNVKRKRRVYFINKVKF